MYEGGKEPNTKSKHLGARHFFLDLIFLTLSAF